MSKIIIVPRLSLCCVDRLSNYRVSIYSDNAGAPGDLVWTADMHTDGSNPGGELFSQDLLTADLDLRVTMPGGGSAASVSFDNSYEFVDLAASSSGVMRIEVLRSMRLHSNGFGIEPELTAKIFKRGYRVYEVPITYDGRGYEEGKKIGWRDGVVALWVLLKYRFTE